MVRLCGECAVGCGGWARETSWPSSQTAPPGSRDTWRLDRPRPVCWDHDSLARIRPPRRFGVRQLSLTLDTPDDPVRPKPVDKGRRLLARDSAEPGQMARVGDDRVRRDHPDCV